MNVNPLLTTAASLNANATRRMRRARHSRRAGGAAACVAGPVPEGGAGLLTWRSIPPC